METLCLLVTALSILLWVGFALMPWGLWRNREVLEAAPAAEEESLTEITAVIPARNEAEVIEQTLRSVGLQGMDIKIILLDDASEDGTAAVARKLAIPNS